MTRHLYGMFLVVVSGSAMLALAGCGDRRRTINTVAGANSGSTTATTTPATTRFEVVIENLSDGTQVATPLSPGAWIVHDGTVSLFTPGAPDRGEGLEALAEDGSPAALAASFVLRNGVQHSGELGATPRAERRVVLAKRIAELQQDKLDDAEAAVETLGEVVRLVSPLTGVDHDVEVVSAHFVDPEGERLRA